MSTTSLSSHHKIHRRNSSGELDVFEAARYFSIGHEHTAPSRMSLDMPMIMRAGPLDFPHGPNNGQTKHPKSEGNNKNKAHKQPSSPGGRLASFLNSLFNQTTLKKKKPKPGKDFDDDNGLSGARRKRRSSISHFRVITSSAASSTAGDNPTNNNNSYSYYRNNGIVNSKKSGFRTPPPYADTPTKSYKAVSVVSSEKNGPENRAEKKGEDRGPWIFQEKSRVIQEKNREALNLGFFDWKSTEERETAKFGDVDDGGESDSSSDLFDLPSHELDFYSSGLPVYESTQMDRIKIGVPISRATIV
ncbi:plasma membrane fusion protein prm1 [Striga asiatica]|uniref:Plasma membrane fusion protein prm1 n=1 Tax=Striga asiatica TaxID=4170 RepID=A0A5A7Q5Q8_STRAF|nr:plasma membrane fusion protein prm1 [Striga asiatica]